MKYFDIFDIIFSEDQKEKGMTERDLMRLFEEYDGEISMSDFAPDELEEMLGCKPEELAELKKKYFDFYDDVKSPSLPRQDW